MVNNGNRDGRGVRDLIGPILAANLVVNMIVLGLAGWSLDKYIDGEQDHPHLGGNTSTSLMLVFALIGGVVGVTSLIPGLMHIRVWHCYSLPSASALALLSWALTALAFGLVCKEIILGGRRGKRLQTLEAFVVISLLSQFLYVVLLHSGIYSHQYGPGYRDRKQQNQPQDTHDHDHGHALQMAHQPDKTATSHDHDNDIQMAQTTEKIAASSASHEY